jgi:uncharacterized protein (UPF0332 family)
MAGRISPEIQRLLADRKLIRATASRAMVLKELDAAKNDLAEAKDSLDRQKYKWATIQGYYSMFHSARALLYSRGFREKSHYALLIALRELFKNELENSLILSFEEAMDLRQEADYGLKFSEAGAIETVESAEELLKRVEELFKMS